MSTKQVNAGELAALKNQDEHSKQLQMLGLEALKAVVAVSDRYFNIITFIREKEIDKKLASHSLGAVGFARPMVSKLLTIAHAPPDVFDLYAARTVGFNKVLKLTRDAEKQIRALAGKGEQHLLEAVDAAAAAGEAEAEAEEAERGAQDTTATKTTRLAKVCIQALKLMEGLGKKTYTKTREGYTLTIVKSAGLKGEVVPGPKS